MSKLVLMPNKLLIALDRVTEEDLIDKSSSLYLPAYTLDETSTTGKFKVKDLLYRNTAKVILSSVENILPDSVVYLSNTAMQSIDLYRFIPLGASLRDKDDLFLIPVSFVDAFETL